MTSSTQKTADLQQVCSRFATRWHTASGQRLAARAARGGVLIIHALCLSILALPLLAPVLGIANG